MFFELDFVVVVVTVVRVYDANLCCRFDELNPCPHKYFTARFSKSTTVTFLSLLKSITSCIEFASYIVGVLGRFYNT